MRIRPVQMIVDIELGRLSWCVIAVIKANCVPAEPMVRYYRDGSGYPGSPAYAELVSVHVLKFHCSDRTSVERSVKNNDWFECLDSIARNYVINNFDSLYEPDLLELAYGEFD